MSDLIEKAASRLGKAGDRSLVERAADELVAEPLKNDAVRDGAAQVGTVTGELRLQAGAGPVQQHKKTSKYAAMDLKQLNARGLVTPLSPRSRVAEEFRVVKRPLLRKAFRVGKDAVHNGNLIMVVSTAPNEGKTFTAINLAMSMASEWDKQVLLVEADFSNPGVLKQLGIEADRGLVDVLEDPAIDLADVLIRTNVEDLTLLPLGRLHESGTELLASARMGELIEEMARRYQDRLIIFDTGPALASSEAGTLAAHVGQIVFLVEAEKTSDAEIRAALEMLSACESIFLLLNKLRWKGQMGQFGSYYKSHNRSR